MPCRGVVSQYVGVHRCQHSDSLEYLRTESRSYEGTTKRGTLSLSPPPNGYSTLTFDLLCLDQKWGGREESVLKGNGDRFVSFSLSLLYKIRRNKTCS